MFGAPCSRLIQWNEAHLTVVRHDTKARRSKRIRRMLRAANRGDLKTAWRLMVGRRIASAIEQEKDHG